MSLAIKSGVRVFGLSTPMLLAIRVAENAFGAKGYQCVITAGIDGKHTAGSSHYAGNACDFRTRDCKPDDVMPILKEIQDNLTADFFAQIEEDHIHIQFKPATTYGA